MGLAEREMLFSAEDLSITRPDESVPHQELAIEYLTEAQQEMQDELAERIEQMTGGDQDGETMPGGKQPFSGLGERFSQNQGRKYDPLGRPLEEGGGGSEDGQYPDSDVKIPDEAQRKRVEEILRTLRERSGAVSSARRAGIFPASSKAILAPLSCDRPPLSRTKRTKTSLACG